jgi:hypothetical protein
MLEEEAEEAAAAAEEAAAGAASSSSAAAAAEPATAAVAEDGMKLKLVFSREAALQLGSEMSKHDLVRVLSVVVLAKSRKKDRGRPCSSGTDSVSTRSTSSRSTGSTGSSMLAAAAAAAAVSGAVVPGVIAHLPLLLLPAAAATEMQGVFEAAVACGVDRMQANQQLLLRLVQDWALLMLLLDGSSGSGGGSSSSSSSALSSSSNSMLRSPLQLVQQSLNDSLSSYFAQHKLEHCLKLLQSVAGAASNSAAKAARLQRQQQLQAQQQQQQQQTYKPHFSADFYLYTFKIANCTAQHSTHTTGPR